MKITMLATITLLLSLASQTLACPNVLDLIDYNCNQKIKIMVTGDSIPAGYGDKIIGGYVTRVKRNFVSRKVTFPNIGVPGITSARLLRNFKRDINKSSIIKRTKRIDVAIIDVGRNDYWDGTPPSYTVRNIRRLKKFLKNNLENKYGVAPLVLVAALIPNNRSFQRPFINAVNKRLFALENNLVRFDKLNKNLIASDGLHPSPRGYRKMTELFTNFINGKLQTLLSERRPDSDLDGVFDLFETDKFGTDPLIADTDGDTFNDGEELFNTNSNPLDPLDPAA